MLKRIGRIFICNLFVLTILSCKSNISSVVSVRKTPIDSLAIRVLGKNHALFVFLKTNDSLDNFSLESNQGKIIIKGNNYNSMAVGLNYYLKNYCHAYVSWYVNDKIDLAGKLPSIPDKITKSARIKNRFFLNYCTFGYTMPWWQWKDWERLIDWMALNGVTMPLAITGQEAIWYDVWKEYGLSDEQIRTYFTGPAHLPWHRMSNLDKWGGPLPMSWLNNQKELQKRIVKRERELGMTPVLPAFSGHVPEALKSIFPDAKINQLTSWGGFKDQYRSFFLDPLDPKFKEIQHRFLKKQTEVFGTDHVYGADPFNEVHPPSWEPDYLATVSSAIYSSMKDIDSKATWLQMSWIFYFEREHWTNERIKAMLKAVPQNKMMLLDYYCENQEVWKITNSFFNKPFIWCYLGNFGGNTMLAGNIDTVEERIENAISNNKNLWGIGSTLEAFDVNPLMYDYLFEKAWGEGKTDTKDWIKNWADLRYGRAQESARKSWDILHYGIYKDPAKLGQGTLTNARPTLSGSGNWTTNSTIAYDNNVLYKSWKLLLENPSQTSSYQYDVVNIGRQVLGNYFLILREKFTKSYNEKKLTELKVNGKAMVALFDDLDKLLATQSSFLVGKWLDDAKAFGENEEEKKYYNHNARNIITTWGDKDQSLNDYANRSWAGLTKSYYKKRWEMFINDITQAVENNKPFDEKVFHNKVTQFEWDWTQGNEVYSSKPVGNSIDVAKEIIKKYDENFENK
ncbi:alpha-N-acetylglucosaminidase [Flavobacterium sp. LPB0248]|uniref:alpha-N-acetylglucosaminidase n=1 Tax=Flavobacterium sp. LPB0248 TaxID=2614441 RepID=UPI0015A70933|nr:alpha-N-acetylglucosaminidase [Flavobacterium sp. LPB0248]QLC65970.1 alpha-N-acetylglucosaminidase [Flavobacterium sp. LPB0248]